MKEEELYERFESHLKGEGLKQFECNAHVYYLSEFLSTYEEEVRSSSEPDDKSIDKKALRNHA